MATTKKTRNTKVTKKSTKRLKKAKKLEDTKAPALSFSWGASNPR